MESTPFRTVPFFSKVKVSFGAKKIMALDGNFKIVILKFQFEPWLEMGKIYGSKWENI